jgi:hypothetical protein
MVGHLTRAVGSNNRDRRVPLGWILCCALLSGVGLPATAARAGAPPRASVTAAAAISQRGTVVVEGRVRPRRAYRVHVQERVVQLLASGETRTRWVRRVEVRSRPGSGRYRASVRYSGGGMTLRAVVLARGKVIATSGARSVRGTATPAVTPASTPAAGTSTPPSSEQPPSTAPHSTPQASTATLGVGQTLAAGARLVSPNAQYRLEMQSTDGNLVLYRGSTATWSTGPKGAGARAAMQDDGNLVIYVGSVAKWSSGTAGLGAASLRLQDDGNAVIYQGPRPLWSTGTGYLGDQLLAGASLPAGASVRSRDGRYRLVMQASDGNLVLYNGASALWSTGAYGAGSFAAMQGDGNFVVYTGSQARWSSNTARFTAASLTVQDDGNVVVYQGGHARWSRATGYIGDKLSAGATLQPGAYLWSPNKQYMLVMQPADGNLVIYGPSAAVWAWDTAGHPGARAVMQEDGNFVVYAGSTALRWSSTQTRGAHLRMQDDSNLVVYDGATALWSRITGLIGGVNGPLGIANSAIADQAERYANGTYQGQCLVFALAMIRQAGGPSWAFGLDTSVYQAKWAERAVQISGIANARRGDIVQWGGGAGGNQLHTAIITAPGSNPSVIDSNYGSVERVGRGSFSSRNPAGSVYRIWRVGRL